MRPAVGRRVAFLLPAAASPAAAAFGARWCSPLRSPLRSPRSAPRRAPLLRRFRAAKRARRAAVASASPPPATLPVTLFNTTVHVPGRLVLLCVPALWASYGVCIKCLYALPWALSPALFNMLRLLVGSLAALPALVAAFRRARSRGASALLPALVAGFELGAWTITTNVLQMNALRHTTASRGAFLNQMSTIIVPIAAYVFGMEKRLAPAVVLASVVSVLGVALLTLDNVSASFSLLGDGVMLLTAFLSTAFILRTKVHTKVAEAGPLVPAKVLAQTTFASLYLLASSLRLRAAPTSFGALFAGATPMLLLANVAMVLWGGIFVSWMSTVLQVKGQKLVAASETVIIFTSMPLWASVWAWPLGERFGAHGLVGASLILGATAIAAASASKKQASR